MGRKKGIMAGIFFMLLVLLVAGYFLRGRSKSSELIERNRDTVRTEKDFPQELTAIPGNYSRACEQPGTVVRLDYDTYESFTYEEKS